MSCGEPLAPFAVFSLSATQQTRLVCAVLGHLSDTVEGRAQAATTRVKKNEPGSPLSFQRPKHSCWYNSVCMVSWLHARSSLVRKSLMRVRGAGGWGWGWGWTCMRLPTGRKASIFAADFFVDIFVCVMQQQGGTSSGDGCMVWCGVYTACARLDRQCVRARVET